MASKKKAKSKAVAKIEKPSKSFLDLQQAFYDLVQIGERYGKREEGQSQARALLHRYGAKTIRDINPKQHLLVATHARQVTVILDRDLELQKKAESMPVMINDLTLGLYFALKQAHGVLAFDKALMRLADSVPNERKRALLDTVVHHSGRKAAIAQVKAADALAARAEVAFADHHTARFALHTVRARLVKVVTILSDSRYNWRGRYKATAYLDSTAGLWAAVLGILLTP